MAESIDLEAIRGRADATLEPPLPDLQWIAHAGLTDAGLASVRRCLSPHAVKSAKDVPALLAEVDRLRTIVAVLTTEDPPCTGWDRAYFGGAVYDADGVALADQAILLMEPCAHAHDMPRFSGG